MKTFAVKSKVSNAIYGIEEPDVDDDQTSGGDNDTQQTIEDRITALENKVDTLSVGCTFTARKINGQFVAGRSMDGNPGYNVMSR